MTTQIKDYDRLFTDEFSIGEWKAITSILRLLYTGGYVIDLGCGTGELLNHFDCDDYIGIDIDDKMIESAKFKFPGVDFRRMDMQDLQVNDNSYDFAVSLFACFNYLQKPSKASSEIYRILKPGGRFLVMVSKSKYGLTDENYIMRGFTNEKLSKIFSMFTGKQIFGFRRSVIDLNDSNLISNLLVSDSLINGFENPNEFEYLIVTGIKSVNS